jgi:hypothetical protein
MLPKIYRTEPRYFNNLLTYHGIKYTRPLTDKRTSHRLFDGFDEYNHLVNINLAFKTEPVEEIIDRTERTRMPYQVAILQPWIEPTVPFTLDEFFRSRIKYIETLDTQFNIMYSGGIDSTALMVGILKYGQLSKYRVIMTPDSVTENPGFYKIMCAHPALELVMLTEHDFATKEFDGLFVTGNGTDHRMSQLEPEFLAEVAYDGLHRPWQEWFHSKFSDPKLLNFCDEFFSRPNKPIRTLLEARWWFYNVSKICLYPAAGWLQPEPKPGFVTLNENWVCPIPFFECFEWESYIYYNMDQIITGDDYASYKYGLKNYIFDYDHNRQYFLNKVKMDSMTPSTWRRRNVILKNQEYIMLLDNGEKIATDNLPLLSQRDYRKKYGKRLDYLFTQQ